LTKRACLSGEIATLAGKTRRDNVRAEADIFAPTLMRFPFSRPLKSRVSATLALALLGASFGSCSPVEPLKPSPAAMPVKTTANTAYRTPPVKSAHQPAVATGVTINRIPVNGPYIAITFDDGPHATFTPRLLDMLRQRNLKATFYVCGNNCELYPDLLRRMIAEGHEIGNHSYNHPNLGKMSQDQVRSQLSRTHEAIVRATGVAPRTFRPPYGSFTQAQREWAMKEYGYPTVLWSVDPFDWKKPGAGVITSRILTGTGNGGIILAHDIHGQTIDAMPATLDGLVSRGYRFATVSQLIAMRVDSAPQASAPAVP
jgi:peptidoglycan/xylan/chitin deacetylase (PgdA/CDA1 family)